MGRCTGALVAPYTYSQRLVSRLERRYEEDRSRLLPLQWLRHRRLVNIDESQAVPLMLFGADSFGRDIFSRLLYAARTCCCSRSWPRSAMLIGIVAGGAAGNAGGEIDEVLSRIADFVLVLPAIYVVLRIWWVVFFLLNK